MRWDIPYCSLILCLGFFFAISRYQYSVEFTNSSNMNIAYTIVTSLFVFSSCTFSDLIPQPHNTGTVTQVVTGGINTGSTDYQTPLVEDLSWSGDVYYPIFKWLETKTIRIQHRSRVPTKISFMNSEAKSMEVSIVFSSATGANLRLSQIVLPSGTTDGPFGQKTWYNLANPGTYQLIFNENMMAGEPWSGEAIISLTLRDSVYEQNAVLIR